MLVLTRKAGERIAIGPNAEILLTIVGISGGRIRIGIEADASIPVQRIQKDPAVFQQEHWSPRETQHVVELAQ